MPTTGQIRTGHTGIAARSRGIPRKRNESRFGTAWPPTRKGHLCEQAGVTLQMRDLRGPGTDCAIPGHVRTIRGHPIRKCLCPFVEELDREDPIPRTGSAHHVLSLTGSSLTLNWNVFPSARIAMRFSCLLVAIAALEVHGINVFQAPSSCAENW